MGGRTGERTNGRTGERANERTGERANERTSERANGAFACSCVRLFGARDLLGRAIDWEGLGTPENG